MPDSTLHIRSNQLVSALSIALDLAQNRSYEHSRRTAYISLRLAKNMGLSKKFQGDIYFAALLHDIGMAGELSKYDINDFHGNRYLRKAHADYGSKIMEKIPFDKQIGEYIRFHHDNWDGSGVNGIGGDDIPLGAHIIHLADSMDILYDRTGSPYQARMRSLDLIKNNSKKDFHPDVVQSFMGLCQSEKFWMDLRHENMEFAIKQIEPVETALVTMDGLEDIAEAFALLIDNKCQFTHRHSEGNADLSKRMGEALRYGETKIRKIGIAAYMHDLGKLTIPNEILDKPGRLTAEEYMKIKSHPYYTKLIIGQVDGCEDIARWAGNHHEMLDGSGYPECLTKDDLEEEDQIIVISDLYQALTEDRPYRKALKKQDALMIMDQLVKDGKISKDMVECLESII